MLISDLFFNVRGCRAKESLCMSSSVMFNLIHGVIEKVRQMSGYGLTDL